MVLEPVSWIIFLLVILWFMEDMVIIHNVYGCSDYLAFNKGVLVFHIQLEGLFILFKTGCKSLKLIAN